MSDEELYKAVRQYEKLGKLVTCGNCQQFRPFINGIYGECQRIKIADDAYEIVKPTDYCSKGVIKETNESEGK